MWRASERLAPLLAASDAPVVGNLGSTMGSIAHTESFRTPSYAMSKAVDEVLTIGYCDQHGMPIVIGRFFNTIGHPLEETICAGRLIFDGVIVGRRPHYYTDDGEDALVMTTPELDDPKVLEWIGRFIGRIHAVGSTRDFAVRPRLDVESFGHEPRAWLLEHEFVPPDLRPAWEAVTAQALEAAARCYQRAGKVTSIRLHGDCHPGNILWTEQGQTHGPHFVDLDDARMGPALQDLWMLLSGDRAAMTLQLSRVLAGYEDFMRFDRRELPLLEALRTLRLVHYCAWIARRWDDPAFPAAFPWFDTQRYWQDRILELREQIALMDDEPLAPG